MPTQLALSTAVAVYVSRIKKQQISGKEGGLGESRVEKGRGIGLRSATLGSRLGRWGCLLEVCCSSEQELVRSLERTSLCSTDESTFLRPWTLRYALPGDPLLLVPAIAVDASIGLE